jgi:hypothetical protein
MREDQVEFLVELQVKIEEVLTCPVSSDHG